MTETVQGLKLAVVKEMGKGLEMEEWLEFSEVIVVKKVEL